MAKPRAKEGFPLPRVEAGSWKGEILGTGSVNFGQSVQPGPPPQSVEFSYILLPASLSRDDYGFRWPGVVMILAPTVMKTETKDAGSLVASMDFPSLSLSIEVTRAQFSDLLRLLETQRLKELRFNIEAAEGDNSWSVRSWDMAAKLI